MTGQKKKQTQRFYRTNEYLGVDSLLRLGEKTFDFLREHPSSTPFDVVRAGAYGGSPKVAKGLLKDFEEIGLLKSEGTKIPRFSLADDFDKKREEVIAAGNESREKVHERFKKLRRT